MRRERTQRTLVLAMVGAAAAAAAGCMGPASRSGSFDKTLEVSGPLHLELGSGSGGLRVVAGSPGQVQVHGDFEAHAWLWGVRSSRLAEFADHPPIEQSQNLIRVGMGPSEGFRMGALTANYSVSVPADTEVHAHSGSGTIFVEGVRGPVELSTGRGTITANQIGGDARLHSGAGDIHLRDVGGAIEVSTGAGDISLAGISGDLRAQSSAGDITIEKPGGGVNVRDGAGDIRITGAREDAQVHNGMGDISLQGNPRPGSYWEVHTGAGDVTLRVPADASFRLHARSGLGDVRSSLPGLVAGRSSHELRGQFGDGSARIEIDAGLGDIHIELAPSPASGSQ